MSTDHDDGNPPRTVHHTFDDETPASFAVVRALCVLENVDPVAAPEELGITLYDHIDPQSLDTVLDSGTDCTEVHVEFTVENYRIWIADSGRLRIQVRS